MTLKKGVPAKGMSIFKQMSKSIKAAIFLINLPLRQKTVLG